MARYGGNTNNPYYGYIQKLQNYFVDNPEGFWADNEKASSVRQWLYKNAPRFMEYAYDNTPEDIRNAIPSKFLSSDLRKRAYMSDFEQGRDDLSRGVLNTIGGVTLAAGAAAVAAATAPAWSPYAANAAKFVLQPGAQAAQWLSRGKSIADAASLARMGHLIDTGIGAYYTAEAANNIYNNRAIDAENGAMLGLGLGMPMLGRGLNTAPGRWVSGKLSSAAEGLQSVYNKAASKVSPVADKLSRSYNRVSESVKKALDNFYKYYSGEYKDRMFKAAIDYSGDVPIKNVRINEQSRAIVPADEKMYSALDTFDFFTKKVGYSDSPHAPVYPFKPIKTAPGKGFDMEYELVPGIFRQDELSDEQLDIMKGIKPLFKTQNVPLTVDKVNPSERAVAEGILRNLEQKFGDIGYVQGSTQTLSRGAFPGLPNDIEFSMPKANWDEFVRRSGLPNTMLMNPQTGALDVSGSKLLTQIGGGRPFDIHFVDDYSKEIFGAARSLDPVKFSELRESIALNEGRAMTVDDVKKAFGNDVIKQLKDRGLEYQNILTDALSNQKRYSDTFSRGSGTYGPEKYKRPFNILTNEDPQIIDDVSKSIDVIRKTAFGKDHKLLSELNPRFNFGDVEANKKFLLELGIEESTAERLAKNEGLMRNLLEYTHMQFTGVMRGIDKNGLLNNKSVFDAANTNFSPHFLSMSGVGGNNVFALSNSGHGPLEFYRQLPVTYDYSKISNAEDLISQLEHLSAIGEGYDIPKILGKTKREWSRLLPNDPNLLDKISKKFDMPFYVGERYTNDLGGNFVGQIGKFENVPTSVSYAGSPKVELGRPLISYSDALGGGEEVFMIEEPLLRSSEKAVDHILKKIPEFDEFITAVTTVDDAGRKRYINMPKDNIYTKYLNNLESDPSYSYLPKHMYEKLKQFNKKLYNENTIRFYSGTKDKLKYYDKALKRAAHKFGMLGVSAATAKILIDEATRKPTMDDAINIYIDDAIDSTFPNISRKEKKDIKEDMREKLSASDSAFVEKIYSALIDQYNKKNKKTYGGLLSLYNKGGKIKKIEKNRVNTDSTIKSFLENTHNYFKGTKFGLIPSSYRPTIGDKGENYYTREGLAEDVLLNLFGGVDNSQRTRLGSRVFYRNFDEAHNNISRIGNERRKAGNATLGNYTVSAGKDDRGRYISFYDIFDYKLLPIVYPFLHPYHIYDRIYEDEVENMYDKIKNNSPYDSELGGLLQPKYIAGDTVLYAKGGKLGKYKEPYKEKLFRSWYDQYAVGNGLVDDLGNVTDPDDKEHYYDYRRYWEDNIFKNPIDAGFIVPYTHLPDTYKMPGHPTMSIESMYHPKNKPGMVWEERQGPYENKEVYRPETEAEYMRRYISPRRDVPYDTDFTLDALDKMVKSYPNNKLSSEDVQYLYDQLMYRSNVDPRVAAYALYTESKFDPKAANKGSSARGISQLIGSAIQDLYPKNYESIQKQYLNGERSFKDQVDDFLNYINKNSDKINGQFNNYGMVKKMMLAPNKSLNAVIDMSTYRKSFTDKQYAKLMARSKRPKFKDIVDMYNEEYDKYMNSLTSELEKEQQEILQKKREDQIKAMANVIVGSGKEKIVKDFIDRINAQKQSNPNNIYNRAYQELHPFNSIRYE